MFVWIVERKEVAGWKPFSGHYNSREDARSEKEWVKDAHVGEGYKFRIRKYVREEE